MKKSVCIYLCMYVCMYVCMFVSLTKISLTPIATLYDNGFSGRVQNSTCAFNFWHFFLLAVCQYE